MPRSHPLVPAVLLLAAALLPGAAGAADAVPVPDAEADYERLLEWRYSGPVPVPDGGVTFRRDTATWTLESGTLHLAEPTAGGAVTGLVFEGRGRFRMEVPDPVEREQLHRFSRGAAAEVLDVAFSQLVLRASGGVDSLVGAEATGPYERSGLATERQDLWLKLLWLDADGRVMAGLLDPGDVYLRAEMETDEHGWLLFEYEPWRREEIELQHRDHRFTEVWVSLDRAEDRLPSGRPSLTRRRMTRLRHVDVRADLTEAGRRRRAGITEIHPRLGRFTVDLHLVSRVAGSRALRFKLRGGAEVGEVLVDGRPAPVLRLDVGERFASVRDLYEDDDLVVVLDEPLAEGRELTVSVDYELELYNYAPGRSWYPEEADSYLGDPHTGSLDLTLPERIEVRAMGRRVEEPVLEGRTRRVRWEVEEPTFMLTFTYAERAFQYDLEVEGAPHIEVFGPGMGKEAKFHNVAADAANSIRFFQELFQVPLDDERILVSSIVDGHGQAFDGFLHMGEFSFYLERPGASELFRAHEVAHQWWGHRVLWATYRDQWLSEAFAEYSAMMYVQSTMERGEHWFEEILFAYREALLGSIKASMSKFSRTGVAPLNDLHRERMGPIAVGTRASTARAPGAYAAQAYVRGPWVLHMLRVMLRNLTKSDELFVQVLRDFLREHDGKTATTEDFIASLTKTAPGDWQWFFDQWVYGTAIPTYAWDWKTERGEGGKTVLALTVRQENVPDGFRMPVPVAIDFGRGQEAQAVVLVDEREETFHIPLPAEPKKVQLNPDHAVLAQMK